VGTVRKKYEIKQKIGYKPVGLRIDINMAFGSIIYIWSRPAALIVAQFEIDKSTSSIHGFTHENSHKLYIKDGVTHQRA